MTVEHIPKISVIVPVFNAEKYLHQCIDSILLQSYTDFELLLIDDGSTDKSGEICDEYASKDDRVRVFHKENGGVSSARNLGLDNARGEWVTFVDSDDYLLDNALDILTDDKREDLIICSYQAFLSQQYTHSNVQNDEVLNTIPAIKEYCKRNLHTVLRSPWGKFFKRNIIDVLRFDEGMRVGEDHLFDMEYLLRVKSCRITHNVIYAYREYETPFFSKYKLKVNESIYILKRLFGAYDAIGVYSFDFEKWMFLDYRQLCREDLDRHPNMWYGNSILKSIYNRVKKGLSWEFRLKYYLLSMPLFVKVNKLLRK